MRWIAVLGIAVGIGAEWVAFGWDDARHWFPDLAVGWTFIAGGLVASSRRPGSRIGALLAATGFAWFAGNFVPAATSLHRGLLVHTLLAYPRGRLASRLDRAAVVAGYALSVVPRSDAATATLGSVLAATATHDYRAARGGARRARALALRAATLIGCVLIAGAVARLALPAGDANEPVLLAYEAALCAVVVMLVGGLRQADDAAVADLVVELGQAPSGTLRDELARALGEPTLEVGYWSPEAGGYVDAAGRPLALPEPGAGRSVTLIARDAEPIAALVHDPALLGDPALVDGIATAARLAAVNARLQADVRAQLAELQASRRRLVEAGDEERRRLEQRLREGAERRLRDLAATLAGAHSTRLARAEEQLALTLEDLHELARGLHPRVVVEKGLAGAIAELAAGSPVDVDVSVPARGLPVDVEAALYFVFAEALANVAKHACASRATIVIDRHDDRLSARIADDGVGGAALARGSGLRGLADRVEALGGTLELDSPAASGTRITVEIPLSRSSATASRT